MSEPHHIELEIADDFETRSDQYLTTKEGKGVAEKMLHLIKEGMTPGQAARACGTTLTRLSTRGDTLKRLRELMAVGSLDVKARKALWRALPVKIALEHADDDPKLALKALDVMKHDPELELNIGAPLANFNFSKDFDEVLDSVEIDVTDSKARASDENGEQL